ncbi:putative transposable element [Trichonephila clavipes]|nr:putative transposable element [Trichonephila clavipes]
MVWAGIMINGRTRLHVVANGTMTGQRYIDEVLLPHVRLFRGAVGDKLVFMDDNATFAGRNYPPTNKNTIIHALTEEWDKLPQQLLDNVVQSMVFVDCVQNKIAVFPDFHKRILFSDEAHFWLNGYVNKQNCPIWSESNAQVNVETPLHPEKLIVCCALWAGGIIGPYFFKTDEGHNVTVNVDRYRGMITKFFIPELNNHDVQELGFQQDGATCHTARATIDLLKDTFGDRLISRFVPVKWPPRSCDLTP